MFVPVVAKSPEAFAQAAEAEAVPVPVVADKFAAAPGRLAKELSRRQVFDRAFSVDAGFDRQEDFPEPAFGELPPQQVAVLLFLLLRVQWEPHRDLCLSKLFFGGRQHLQSRVGNF